ncbi:MAG: hypothetical protein QHH05_09640 [Syntrophomonadaceae bacterium]|jgi:polyhydroxyalkanoate synthesis regulator phasin|nr:hypothetical protein [Syntrophomonadaceae bacterium]MDH7498688.1 hypothetical protein [Syntrophomonadaceae bacterium]
MPGEFVRKALYFGLGVLAVTRESAEKWVSDMVEKGEMSRDEARKFVDEVVERGEQQREEAKNFIRQEIAKMRDELGLISREELEELRQRVEALEARQQEQA